ncbi:unnamed protein product [Orchesella dallaii]|uniref:KEN domain-containing protein n=1 Tax=Orchesella dallaii TaxID=48710 RepID=A0ABP1RAN7_9HEXA
MDEHVLASKPASSESMEEAENAYETEPAVDAAPLHVILSQPLLWPSREIVSFLKCVSDELDMFTRENTESFSKRYKKLQNLLQENATKIFSQNWKTLLTTNVENYARNQSYRVQGYNGDFVQHLLRYIRNTANHYRGLPPEVQEEFGEYPQEFIAYYIRTFPNLIPIVYAGVLESGVLEESGEIREFYTNSLELPYNSDDFGGYADGLMKGIQQYISTGGLRKRYVIQNGIENTNCEVLILRIPDGILPIVFNQGNITIQINDGFITVHHAPRNLQDSQLILKHPINLTNSVTILLGRDEVMSSTEWKVPTNSSQVILLTKLKDPKAIDNAIQNATKTEKDANVKEAPLRWEELKSTYQKSIILHRSVMFQGCEITLSDMFTWIGNPETNENLKVSKLNGEFLQNLIDDRKPVILHPSIPKLISYYIDRTVLPRKFLPFDILHTNSTENNNQIFVIDCSNEEDISNFCEKLGPGCSPKLSSSVVMEGNVSQSHVIILENEAHAEIISHKTILPVHLLKFHGASLVWLKSWGSNNFILKHLNSITMSEPEFTTLIQRKSIQNQPIIIGDSPGMGKTTILFNLANQLIKLCPFKVVKCYTMTEFVSEVDKRLIGNNSKSKPDPEKIMHAIIDILCKNPKAHPFYNHLVSNFLKPSFDEAKNAFPLMFELMLDGLDEVDSTQWKLAMTILYTVCEIFKSVRLWVSTRLQHLFILERLFSTNGYGLEKLERDDQVRLLVRYWSQEMAKNEKETHLVDLEKCANYCLNHAPRDYMDIAGIPLQCRLLAEVHEVTVKSLQKREILFDEAAQSLRIKSVLDLYEKAVEAKLHIYMEKQYVTKCVKSLRITKREKETMNVGHEKKAVELLMSRWVQSFVTNYFLKDKCTLDDILAYGIVESRRMNEEDHENPDSFSFIHRTFAEYFVALFTVDLLYWEGPVTDELLGNIGDFLIHEVLKMEDYKEPAEREYPHVPQPPKVFTHAAVIIKFFNSILQKTDEDIPETISLAIFRSLQRIDNWADHLSEMFHILIHTKQFGIFRILKYSLEQENETKLGEILSANKFKPFDKFFKSLEEDKKLSLFIKTSSQSKIGDLICSAVRQGDFNLLKNVCEFLEKGGITVNQIDYMREDYFDGKIKSKMSSPLEPLRLALRMTLNYELIHYLVIEKGFSYSPERKEGLGGVGLIHLCIHQIYEDYLIRCKGEDCLEEGLKVIEFFVNQNRNLLEEGSVWYDQLPDPLSWYPLYDDNKTESLTPLVYAGAVGAPIQVIKTLLNLGANVNAGVNLDNKTMLHFIGYRTSHTRTERFIHGHTPEDLYKIATWAFEHGYNPEIRDTTSYKSTFFHNVVDSYHDLLPATFELFHKYKVDFNAVNGKGQSVLENVIASDGTSETIQTFIKAGCHLSVNATGQNALHLACKHVNLPAVQCFVEKFKFKIHKKCLKGNTPLHYVMMAYSVNPSRLEIVKYLISKGAKINLLTRFGTPLFMIQFRRRRRFRSAICLDRDVEILKFFVEQGAKITKNMCNELILRVFAQAEGYYNDNEREAIFSLLQFVKEKGGNIHYRFKDGRTLLHFSCGLKWFEVVKWLVEDCELNVNAKDKKGKLPIDYLPKPASKLANYLIEKGCVCDWNVNEEPARRREVYDFLFQ